MCPEPEKLEIVASFAVISAAVNPVTDTLDPSCLKVTLADIGEVPDVWAIVITGAGRVGFLIKTRRPGKWSLTVPLAASVETPIEITSLLFKPFKTVTKEPDE